MVHRFSSFRNEYSAFMYNKIYYCCTRRHPLIKRHSHIAHAAYHDLKRSLLDEVVSTVRGTPRREQRNGRNYWYDIYRIGSDVRKKYIGEDTPELQNRLDHIKDLKEDAAERKKNRTRLIKIIRAEGFLNMDAATGSLLSAMANAGAFRLGGTIVGTYAFRLYESELGIRYSFDQMAQTGDIDIASFEALSLALAASGDTVETPLNDVLSEFSFAPAPSLNDHRTWRWRQTRNEMLVEFLTPSFQEEETIRPLAALGVDAQSLYYLNYLLAEPIKAAGLYRSGVLVQIPRPERYAIHKLIVSDRRRGGSDSLKSQKDMMQAEFLIGILAEDRPDELKEAYHDAINSGPRWQERLQKALSRMPKSNEILQDL